MTTDDELFGPLPQKYCSYFYFLSVFGMISLFVYLFIGLYAMINKPNKTSPKDILLFFTPVLYSGVIYFQNRLLYSMCVGSTK